MNSDHLTRDKIIVEWFFQDWIGDKTYLPEPEDVFIFMKIIIDIVSTKCLFTEFERKYIVGRAAILGVPQEMLDKLQTYQPDLPEDINKLFQNIDLPHVKKTRMGIIYNIFRVLDVDHKIHPKEVEAIYIIGKRLGASEEQIKQIQSLYEEEEILRQKRASLLFPRGFNDALLEYQKLH